ncbi:MAG TPA: hypothetical protein VNL14_20340 [Candidatus Acidoferrales bacterium]|nr:hypothetical protein [Candidatus Acidoferrales bacterium]
MNTFRSIANSLKRLVAWASRTSSDERGPDPGNGAVMHHSSGEADFDGRSGDALPPDNDNDRDAPYPRKRSGG